MKNLCHSINSWFIKISAQSLDLIHFFPLRQAHRSLNRFYFNRFCLLTFIQSLDVSSCYKHAQLKWVSEGASVMANAQPRLTESTKVYGSFHGPRQRCNNWTVKVYVYHKRMQFDSDTRSKYLQNLFKWGMQRGWDLGGEKRWWRFKIRWLIKKKWEKTMRNDIFLFKHSSVPHSSIVKIFFLLK